MRACFKTSKNQDNSSILIKNREMYTLYFIL